MKPKSSGHAYLVSRAVEEPLEASFELSADIHDISSRLSKPLRLGFFGHIIFIILLIPSIYHTISMLAMGLLGAKELTIELLLKTTVLGLILIFLLSIIVTSILYIIQIHKFNRFNLQRCRLVSDLRNAEFAEHVPEKREIEARTESAGKHLKNPIFAMLDLEEESMHVIPQIVKMLRFITYFIFVIMMFLLLTSIMKLAFNVNLIFSLGLWEFIFGIAAVILFIPSLKLLVDSENHFRYVQTRHDIIDSVRFKKDISVPEGENQLIRLLDYLMENDPYIKSSALANDECFSENVVIKGLSGEEHRFDAYFSGVNILKERSVSLGMPMGKFAVFVSVFKGDVTLDKLHKLREAIIDICKKEDRFPLRIISLQWDVKELEDDVYEYVLENPILMKNTLTHLEIIAEDGKVYSFIPMISYGDMTG